MAPASDSATGAPRDPVEKAFEILRWLIDEPGDSWGVRELARALGRPPSTVYRALSRLESEALVALDPRSGRYSIGLEMYRLSAKVSARFSLREAATPTLVTLRDRFDETAFLGLLDPHRLEMVMVRTVESTHELRYVVAVNEWRPLYLGASGIAILAFLPANAREQVLSRIESAPAERTGPVRAAHVRALIDRAQADGYARTIGERVPDAVGVAAPLYEPHGGVIGSIGVTLPSSRFDSKREHEFASSVIDAAERVAHELIY